MLSSILAIINSSYKPRFNNFLHIKSVTLANQNQNQFVRKLNLLTKNTLHRNNEALDEYH